jgi:hypothetical protein
VKKVPLAYFIHVLLLQDVRLIQLSTPEVQYSPGDVLMVCPHNAPEKVDQLFSLLSVGSDRRLCPDTVIQVTEGDNDAPVPLALKHPLTLRRCAEQYWDLNVSLRNGISLTVKLGLSLRAEHRLRVLEVVFLRTLFGFINEEVTEKCRKLYSGNIYD